MKQTRVFVGDFETTVFQNQEYTEVWASALVELYTEDVIIHHSIEDLFNYIISLNSNLIIYYHNLKFDGEFWLSYLLVKQKFSQAYYKLDAEGKSIKWYKDRDMKNRTLKYSISDMGQWYTITFKVNNHYIELRDSLKLLPFQVKKIGEGFKTKHQKLEIEYKGFRYAGCEITEKEKDYISNDVLVVKEGLEFLFNEGHNKLTIGACCMSEYKKICKQSMNIQLEWEELFPDLSKYELDFIKYSAHNADEYIRKSYKGGWSYVVKGKENQMKYNGLTVDVNSLYSSMMHSSSNNYFPVGLPHFWKGDIPEKVMENEYYYFIRIKTRFRIKKNYLPFVQVKNTLAYMGTEMLETSDIYDRKTDKYYDKYYDFDGNLVEAKIILTLTMTDYKLLQDHYDLYDTEILDGCWFYKVKGLFDEYIDPFAEIKQNSKGARRELAKLFLNSLYGKFATNNKSSFKVAYIKEDGTIGYYIIQEYEKDLCYIPIGSAITSYARNFTIRAAQKNYYGKDKKGFIYADTDSIHCDLKPEELKGIPTHPTKFSHWKIESSWDKAIFVRQKTYIEHVIAENLEPIDKPYHNIKCAGMPERSKNLLRISFDGIADSEYFDTETGTYKKQEWSEEEKEFLFNEEGEKIIRNYEDFKIGFCVPDKLRPKRMKGGVVLVDTTYLIR